jgi:hypothetical protein
MEHSVIPQRRIIAIDTIATEVQRLVPIGNTAHMLEQFARLDSQ